MANAETLLSLLPFISVTQTSSSLEQLQAVLVPSAMALGNWWAGEGLGWFITRCAWCQSVPVWFGWGLAARVQEELASHRDLGAPLPVCASSFGPATFLLLQSQDFPQMCPKLMNLWLRKCWWMTDCQHETDAAWDTVLELGPAFESRTNGWNPFITSALWEIKCLLVCWKIGQDMWLLVTYCSAFARHCNPTSLRADLGTCCATPKTYLIWEGCNRSLPLIQTLLAERAGRVP